MSSVSDYIQVNARITPSGAGGATAGFGNAMFVTSNPDVLGTGSGERVRRYSNVNDLALDFAPGSEPYKAGSSFFAQLPNRQFLVGPWDASERDVIAGTLITATTAADAIQALSGTINLTYKEDGIAPLTGITQIPEGVAGLESAVGILNRALEATQAGSSPGDVANIEAFRYVAVNATQGKINVIGAVSATLSTTAGDFAGSLAAPLGLAEPTPGTDIAVEPFATAISAIASEVNDWYFLTLDADTLNVSGAVVAAARWCESDDNSKMLVFDETDASVLTTNESASTAAQLRALAFKRTAVVYSATPDYKSAAVAGRLASVDFSSSGALIDPMYDELVGTAPDDALTSTQRAELARKRVNFYNTLGTQGAFQRGWTVADDGWMDTQYWIDEFVSDVRGGIFGVLRSSNRVAQTDAGIERIRNAITASCERGVRNGGIAPGTVSTAAAADIRAVTLNPSFGRRLPLGYLVHIGALADQTDIDRAARRSPAIRVFVRGSGSIQTVSVNVDLSP